MAHQPVFKESTMPLNLLTLPTEEAERIAYAEGFTMAAQLFARIADLEAQCESLTEELDQCRNDLHAARHERAYGSAD
jgi:hypothetical protein